MQSMESKFKIIFFFSIICTTYLSAQPGRDYIIQIKYGLLPTLNYNLKKILKTY